MRDDGVGPWVVPLGLGVVVLVILVVVAVTFGRDEDPVPASGGPAAASATGTDEASATPTPSAPSTAVAESADIFGPAHEALEDGFPVMIPAELPAGWTTSAATYTPGEGADGPVWQLSFVLPDGGEVVLAQSGLALDRAVIRYLGADAVAAGRVDLRDWGTGYWSAYTVGSAAGLAKALPTETSVVIAAPDQQAAVTLAKYLLTAEDGQMPEAG